MIFFVFLLKDQYKKKKMIKKYTQEEFINNEDVFQKCEEIFLEKFYLEVILDCEEVNDLTFFTMEKDEKIIGWGSYQTGLFYVIEIVFEREYEGTHYQIELLKHLINEIGEEESIYVYQAFNRDYEFYYKNGFELYKDYGQFFTPGSDYTRYILQLKNKNFYGYQNNETN